MKLEKGPTTKSALGFYASNYLYACFYQGFGLEQSLLYIQDITGNDCGIYIKMMTVVTSLAGVTFHLPTYFPKPAQIFILSQDFGV